MSKIEYAIVMDTALRPLVDCLASGRDPRYQREAILQQLPLNPEFKELKRRNEIDIESSIFQYLYVEGLAFMGCLTPRGKFQSKYFAMTFLDELRERLEESFSGDTVNDSENLEVAFGESLRELVNSYNTNPDKQDKALATIQALEEAQNAAKEMMEELWIRGDKIDLALIKAESLKQTSDVYRK